MDRSARRWFAYLVVTPLGLMPLGGCGNPTVEPIAQVEAERGIPPLLLPCVDTMRSMGSDSHQLTAHTTLADRTVESETPRRLPPVEDLAGNMPYSGGSPDMRIASARSGQGNYDNFQIIPLPPVNESYGAGEATPYLASLPQSVVVPPRTESSPEAESEPDLPDLAWPSADEAVETAEAADSSDAVSDDLDPVAEVEPKLDADLEISEPTETASVPAMEQAAPVSEQATQVKEQAPLSEPVAPVMRPALPLIEQVMPQSIATPDKPYDIRPLPPVIDSEISSPAPGLVKVPGKIELPLQQAPATPVLSERAKAMRVVSEQAAVHVRRGMSLASRNAHFSARSEFIQSLRLISQALDVANDSHEYTEALSDGLRALDEADDFVPRGTQLEADLSLEVLIRSHRTPVLKEADPKSLRPIFARQEYYNYAQKQLAHCAEGDRSGSMALYGLAKVRATLAESHKETASLELPKAMALYQAAMLVDGDNYMASNELGVLLARYGQYESAQSLLEHSVRVHPQPATWHNLAVVYQHLGKTADVQVARGKHAQLTQVQRKSVNSTGDVVWKPVEEFNRSTARSQPPVAQSPQKTAAEKSEQKR